MRHNKMKFFGYDHDPEMAENSEKKTFRPVLVKYAKNDNFHLVFMNSTFSSYLIGVAFFLSDVFFSKWVPLFALAIKFLAMV